MCLKGNPTTVENLGGGKAVTFNFTGDGSRLFSGEKQHLAEEVASRFDNVQLAHVSPEVRAVLSAPKSIEVNVLDSDSFTYTAFAAWQLGGERHATLLVTDTSVEAQTLLTIARPIPRTKHARVVLQCESNSVEGEGGRSMTVWLNKNHTLGFVHNEGQIPPKGADVRRVASGLYMIGAPTEVQIAVMDAFPHISFAALTSNESYVNDKFVPKLWSILFDDLIQLHENLK